MDLKAGIICKLLQLIFPKMQTAAIASPIVTVDVDPVCFRKSPAPYTCPPAEYAFRSKFCSIMVSAKVDKSCVVIQYVYAVGGNLAEFRDWEVMVQNLTWILCFSVFLSVVLEIADILLFLCIDRNHWQPLFKKISSFAVYEFKLLIPVRWGSPTWSIFWFACLLYPSFSRMLLTERKLMSI